MTGPQRFRSRPIEIVALQWTGDNPAAMRAFTGIHHTRSGGEHMVFTTQGGPAELFVAANDAWLTLDVGEWVIRDEHGFYPCKPDVFARRYLADESPLPAEVRAIVDVVLSSPAPIDAGTVEWQHTVERKSSIVRVSIAALLTESDVERFRRVR